MLLKSIEHTVLMGEDQEELRCLCEPGLLPEHIQRFERQLGIEFPPDFRAYLECANGCDFFGLALLGLVRVNLHEGGLYAFHDWGNGDFDCLLLEGPNRGGVVFMNHSPAVTAPIAPSFAAWLDAVYSELSTCGGVAHPSDYRRLCRDGIYASVLAALADVDCELNSH